MCLVKKLAQFRGFDRVRISVEPGILEVELPTQPVAVEMNHIERLALRLRYT